MSVVAKLFKLAYHLDLQGLHSEADAIAEVMKSLSERVGLNAEDMVALADHFDQEGDTALASYFDDMLTKEAKGKHPPPKKWFEKMKKEIKKNNKKSDNKKYTDEVVNEIIGDIWYNNLSDKKREEIYKRHGKKKSPNK